MKREITKREQQYINELMSRRKEREINKVLPSQKNKPAQNQISNGTKVRGKMG